MRYVIGVDIGTSGTKTVLFDENGNSIASYLVEYPLYQPKIGWAEQDPEDWWNATHTSIKAVIEKSGVNPSDIKGVGLSGQMHGLVLLDENGKVLRNSIIWCDQRTVAEADDLTEKIGRERLIEITGNPALTGFTAAKILWVQKNEPEIYAKTAKILLPKDYIRYMLTGEYATEVSDASGMQLMDIKNRCWSDEILEKLNIDKGLLGKMYESCEVTGTVHSNAAELTGLEIGTIVVGGAGDQAAGAVGNGIVKPGIVSSTIGTSGVVFAHMDNIQIDKQGRIHTLCHAVPGKWHVMGCTQGAGLSLKWYRDNFCHAEMDAADGMSVDPYYLMDQQAAKIAPGCEGLMYLPYLMGERSPHNDPNAKGVFFGLSAKHTKYDMLRAVMEGVSYSLNDCLAVVKEMGIDASEVRASGGGGKSKLWRQMQADMFGCDINTINVSEGPALGVALLAAVGAGIYNSVPEACEATIKVKETMKPIAENVDTYKKYFPIYQNVYKALKPQFEAVANVD